MGVGKRQGALSASHSHSTCFQSQAPWLAPFKGISTLGRLNTVKTPGPGISLRPQSSSTMTSVTIF
eukprot:371604-Pelagomonas_calceolata.AAC.4